MTGKNHARCCAAVMAAGGAAFCRSAGSLAAVSDYAGLWSGRGPSVPWPLGLACAFAFGALGSLLPDIDSRSSVLGRHVRLPFGHRTWTHTLWAAMLVAALCGAVPVPGMYGLLAGYVLHLLLDGLSSMGVCWLYPFTRYVYMDGGTWKKGAGGRGPKRAENHRLKLYRTARPDAGRKYVATDSRTGRKSLTDGAVRLGIEAACAATAAACAAGAVMGL